jgi:hypothetical protein
MKAGTVLASDVSESGSLRFVVHSMKNISDEEVWTMT